MGLPILDAASVVMCVHGGTAQPTAPSPRVTINGVPIVTAAAPYAIAGCTLPPQAGGPCATAVWVTPSASTRVTASGVPLLLQTSEAVCAPTGTGLEVVETQPEVSAE